MIDNSSMLLARVAGFIQNLMRFARGQAFVPEVYGQAGELTQLEGECLSLDGLGAQVAGEMHGIANNNAHNSKAAGKTRQRTQVFTAIVPPLQRQHRLRGQAQLVGDSHADAAVANVEGEVARMLVGFQLKAPGF